MSPKNSIHTFPGNIRTGNLCFSSTAVANQKLDEVMPTYMWFLTNTNGFLTREERGERKSCSE